MPKNNLQLDQAGIIRGVKLCASAIRPTYGGGGINAIIQSDLYPYHEVTNDAKVIIDSLHSDDPSEQMGINLFKELIDKADKDSADGRKTTAILCEEILEHGSQSPLKGMALKRELDALIPLIEQKIDEQKRAITVQDVDRVASIAGESEEIGRLLKDIYTAIGKDGIIHLEPSGTFRTSYNTVEGVRLQGSGYLSPFMAHGSKNQAVYEKPLVLVTKKKIAHINDINPLLTAMQNDGKKDLVIFTDDMDSGVASMLVELHKSHVMNVLIIKAPILYKQYVFEDFAKCTGATIVEDASGLNYKNLDFNKHLGTCDTITTDKEETILTGIQDISEHITNLKAENSDDSLLRLSWLNTKTAILKIGANNESELSHKRRKFADAISSARLALEDGIVWGGGRALIEIISDLPETTGGLILKKALEAPYQQNVSNLGNAGWGWEVQDSAKVMKNAVRNAIALASTILTIGVATTIPEPTDTQLRLMEIESKRRPY